MKLDKMQIAELAEQENKGERERGIAKGAKGGFGDGEMGRGGDCHAALAMTGGIADC